MRRSRRAGPSSAPCGTFRLNVFDPTIPAEDTALFRFANRIHIVSRESTLARSCCFDPVSATKGVCWRSPSASCAASRICGDARIRPVSYRDGLVDIEVVTQDTWTLKPEVHFTRTGARTPADSGSRSTTCSEPAPSWDSRSSRDVERDSNVLLYKDANVGGSRWRIDAEYANNSDGWAKKFAFDRPFYALDTRWASGIGLRDERRIDSVYESGQVIHQFATRERSGTVYVGGRAACATVGRRAGPPASPSTSAGRRRSPTRCLEVRFRRTAT
jgi:hypothetical protein